jgi:redox-sensing transcriptional repressor
LKGKAIVNPANSEAVLRRLSHYARCLGLAVAGGIDTVTSEYLAAPCGTTSASVRKDLSIFGEFGKRGSGYPARELLGEIREVLGITLTPPVLLIGAGRVGRAIAEGGIPGGVYAVEALFDTDRELTGRAVGDLTVRHTDELAGIEGGLEGWIAIIAVTPGRAQEAVDILVERGCRSILCLNMEPVTVPGDVTLRRTEMATELDLLTHAMNSRR